MLILAVMYRNNRANMNKSAYFDQLAICRLS